MRITPDTVNSQNFKGLDYTKVVSRDKVFVTANINKLIELGKSYDIKMKSCCVNNPDYASIDIFVTPLKKNMNFFQKLFSPKGISAFDSHRDNIDDGLVEATNEAISRLKKWHNK